MLVSLQMVSFYHRTTFLLEHFRLVLMHEKVLMEYCTQYQIMVTWTQCYFMYSWINCSFQNPDIQQVKNFLILVGHGSHLDIKTTHLCRANNIHLYCLPPHTNHIFQPLDMVIFNPVKSHFSCLMQNVKLATRGWKKPVNCYKTNFTKLFKEPWESMSTALIKLDSQNVVHTLWIETLSIKAGSVNIKCTLLHHQIHHQAVHYLIQFQRHHLSRKISQMKDHMKNN